jgi:hypothetical protein
MDQDRDLETAGAGRLDTGDTEASDLGDTADGGVDATLGGTSSTHTGSGARFTGGRTSGTNPPLTDTDPDAEDLGDEAGEFEVSRTPEGSANIGAGTALAPPVRGSGVRGAEGDPGSADGGSASGGPGSPASEELEA